MGLTRRAVRECQAVADHPGRGQEADVYMLTLPADSINVAATVREPGHCPCGPGRLVAWEETAETNIREVGP